MKLLPPPMSATPKRPLRRLLAVLCLTACGGFLVGVYYDRAERRTVSPVPTPLSNPAPAAQGSPPNGAASEKTEAEFIAMLGQYRAQVADAVTREERLELAAKLHALGRSAHDRGAGTGRVAVAALQEAQSLYLWLADTDRERARVCMDLADALILRGDRDGAVASWQNAVTAAERSHDVAFAADVRHRAGAHFADTGRYAEARKTLQDVLTYSRKAGNKGLTAHTLRYLGGVESDTAHYPAARAYLNESSDLLAEIREKETRAEVLGRLGDLDLLEAKPEDALTRYEEGLAVWRSAAQPFWVGRFLAKKANALVALNDRAEAKRLATESLTLLKASNGPVVRAYPLLVLGDIARAEGDRVTALGYHKEAADCFAKIGNPVRMARAYRALADDYGPDPTGEDRAAKAGWEEKARHTLKSAGL